MSAKPTNGASKGSEVVPASKPARSAVEGVKEESRALRGGIGEELARDTGHFSDADKQLLKFHGSYQQEDRDARKERRQDGLGKHYLFMVRCKIPGGRLTAAQYLELDRLAGLHANGTLRITSRQGIQFHGVLKRDLKGTIAGINACLLTTLGACGDVARNVMACPAPHHHDQVHAQLQADAARLAEHLAPRTGAYHEIWLNGKKVDDGVPPSTGPRRPETGLWYGPSGVWTRVNDRWQETTSARAPRPTPHAPREEEPLYGKVYLPRKFKTGLALPEDNCIDVYAQDLGLLAVVENGAIAGYNVLVGGGMGMSHGNANTFPHLARPVGYVPVAEVTPAAEAVLKLFRDHGNRGDRKRARLKYLVHDWGVERFREVLAGYLGGPLAPPRPLEVSGFDLHLGWHPQGNGHWYYGLSVENGRIKDEGRLRLRTGLRALVERFRPDLRLTAVQDILLCGLDGGALPEVERILTEHGIRRPEQLSLARRHSLACPAIPTCGLAISESERALPGILDELDGVIRQLGLEDVPLSVRMTGCPNGCVRPYQSDVGIVGRSGDKYVLYVGGHVRGHRLNFVLKDLVPRGEIVATLRPLLAFFKQVRRPGESFGDFCQRLGAEKLQALLPAPGLAVPVGNGLSVGWQPSPKP